MTAQTLLDELQARGAVVTAEGSTVWIQPRAVLTDGMRAEIRRLKPELLALLAEQPRCPVASLFCPVDAYDPAAARAYALSDETLTPEQRANLLRYAEEAEYAEERNEAIPALSGVKLE